MKYLKIIRRGLPAFALSFGLVLFVSFFDALAGGGLAIVFKIDGRWLPIEQGGNSLYQSFVGVATIAMLVLIWFLNRRAAYGATILFLGYVNELLYYLFLPVVAVVHDFFLGPDMGAQRLFFPAEIAGYFGWVSRLWGGNFTMPLPTVIIIASGAIALFYYTIFVVASDTHKGNAAMIPVVHIAPAQEKPLRSEEPIISFQAIKKQDDLND